MAVTVDNPYAYGSGVSPISRFGDGSNNDTKLGAGQSQTNSPGTVVNTSLTPQQSDPINAAFYNAGGTPQELTQYLQSLPIGQENKDITQMLQGDIAITDPDSLLDKVLGGVALAGSVGALTAGAAVPIGAAAGAALGAGTAGATAAAGVADGAISGLAGNILTTGGSQGLGKAVGLGALGGGLGAAASLATPYLASATDLPSGVVSGALKAGTGQLTGLIGNALSGSPSQAALGGAIASGQAGQAGTQNNNALAATGAVGNMAVTNNPGLASGSIDLPGLLTGLGQLGTAGLAAYGTQGIQQGQQGAYNMATSAGNYNPFAVNGLGGMGASTANGQTTLNGGVFGNVANMFGNYANANLGQASMYANGVNPYGVTSAGNTAMSVLNPNVQGTQGGLNSALQANQLSQNFAGSLAAQGQAQLNNSLIGQANGNASQLLGSAGANYNSAYQTSLQNQLAALNPQIQQQSNALLNSNFERGQAGTSGGALNVQALQNSFNTADLNAQANAVSQANALMGTTYNAANTASGIGTSQQLSGTNMLNSGLANFNTATGMSNTLNNSIANQNIGLAQTNAQLGQQGLSTQENLASFAPQLASMYGTNANNAVSGFSGINSAALANAGLGTTQGNDLSTQQNNAASNLTKLTTSPTYNANGGAAYGTLLNSIFGSGTGSGGFGALGSGIGNIYNALTGGGTSVAAGNQIVANGEDNWLSSNTNPLGDMNFDFSNLGGNAYLGSGTTATGSWDGTSYDIGS